MLDNEKEDSMFLKTAYVPEHYDETYKMNFKAQISIIGNKEGLKYLAEAILDYLESGDCDHDNFNFDVGVDLSDGSIAMDVICDEGGFFKEKNEKLNS